MRNDLLRQKITDLIGVQKSLPTPQYRVIDRSQQDGYTRDLIEYQTCDDHVRAYLLIPDSPNVQPAILINHQHNSEWHLGKSEVCGLAGNPLQTFGVALVQRGFVVLAPDSICFEDRRKNATGIFPLPGDADFMQHFYEMCYRIIAGENLMKKVIEDAMQGVSLLESFDYVDKNRIGTLGHSYGGNTALFLAALDTRINYTCASGSAVTYRNRMENNVGIEMASVIPGINKEYDIDDVVSCIAPRRLLIVSAENDKYSKDADFTAEQALPAYLAYNCPSNLCHKRFSGGHDMTAERYDFIINWLINSL